MQLANKKIGIWGFGVVGKSATDYFVRLGSPLTIMDNRELTPQEQELLQAKDIPYVRQETQVAQFLANNDFILASPGVDLRPHAQYAHKWLTELDIFCAHFKKPIIAVTGTVGKTTVTHILSHLMEKHLKVWTGGNIGTGMLDLITQDFSTYDAALLELSSFQLEHCKTFTPNVALWTTFSPNHLDRHGTENEYFMAKQQILAYQNRSDVAVIPLSLHTMLAPNLQSTIHFFAEQKPAHIEVKNLFFIQNDVVMHLNDGKETVIACLNDLPDITYQENWLAIISTLHLLKIPINNLTQQAHTLSLPEHRMERVTTINGIDFYNDSKSTTPPSTLAAVNKLRKRPILLLFGGISKGIDRTPVVENLGPEVKAVYCFGREAAELGELCTRFNKKSFCFETLDQAFNKALQDAVFGDQILLSPAGASYDLFKHYKERGDYFKNLVLGIGK